MSESTQIVQALSQVWTTLHNHFGEEWPAAREQLLTELANLASETPGEESVLERLLAIIESSPAAQAAVVQSLTVLSANAVKGYQPLPGRQGAIPAGTTFICPENDFQYALVRVGQPIPKCPNHHLALIENLA